MLGYDISPPRHCSSFHHKHIHFLCASCTNFRISQGPLACRHSLIVLLRLSLHPRTINSTISHSHFLTMCTHRARESERERERESIAPDLIAACGESLFEDKRFPRLRRAAGGRETSRRLGAEWGERAEVERGGRAEDLKGCRLRVWNCFKLRAAASSGRFALGQSLLTPNDRKERMKILFWMSWMKL